MYKTTSKKIFSTEFGEYPPTPLKISHTQKYHDEINVRHIKSPYFHYLRFRLLYTMCRRLLKKKNAKKELQRNIRQSGPIGSKINKHIQKSITELHLQKNSLMVKYYLFTGKILKRNLVFFIWLASILSVLKRSKFEVAGCIVPIDNTQHIFLKNSKEQDITLGHEHIHLLQYSIKVQSQHPNEAIPRHLFRNPKHFRKSLLKSEYKLTYEHIKYLHDPVEAEARLHQFVVDIYRHFHRLPESCNALLFLFIHSDYFLKGGLELIGVEKARMETIILSGFDFIDEALTDSASEDDYMCHIKGSSEKVCDDIQLLQKSLNDRYLEKFLFNDLCYFYARLISYYGDHQLANKLIVEINDLSKYPLIRM